MIAMIRGEKEVIHGPEVTAEKDIDNKIEEAEDEMYVAMRLSRVSKIKT